MNRRLASPVRCRMPRPSAEPTNAAGAPADLGTQFDIHCACGQQHTGQRRRRHQQILCKACGSALFVLPIDVYPTPEAPSKKKKGKRRGGGGRSGESPLGEFVRRIRTALAQRATQAVQALGRAVRWTFTPVKSAIYALLVFVGLTGWFVHHRNSIAAAEVSVVKDAELGLEAMEAKDFALARDYLVVAAEAVDLLDRDDEASRRIVQSSREVSVLADLATSSILELLESVDDSGVDAEQKWKISEQVGFRDQWVALEADVERRSGRVAIDLIVRVAERRVIVRLDSPLFDDIPLDDGPVRMTVAGKVADVRRLELAWEVNLDPDSVFLWESFDLYSELGFPIDPVFNSADAVTSRLLQQRAWQGGQPLDGEEGLVPVDGDGLVIGVSE